MSENPCEGCPLRGTSHKLKAKGKRNAKYLIVSKSPYKGRHFSPEAEDVLLSNLRAVGLKEDDFVIASSVRCDYDPKRWPSKDRKLIETHCRKWLERVVSDLRPKAILSLGADATRAVYGKGVKITKVRGVPEYLEEFDTHVVPTFDPIAVHLYPQHVPLFESDCNTFRRLVDSNFNVSAAERKVRGQYEEIDDLQFLIDLKPKVLAFDLETLGVRWASPEGKILTMQFCVAPGKAYLLSWDHPDNPKTQRQKARLKVQLRQLLQNPEIKILGQNLKYDANWTVSRLGIRFKVSHDTIMLAALVDENAQSIGLDTLTKVYAAALGGYADSFNKKYDKNRMDLIPLSEIVNYGCGDVDATFRVFETLYEIVKNDARLLNHYNRVSIPGINAFVSMEQRGLLIDEQALDEFEQVLSTEVEERYQELIKQVPRSIKRKHLALKKDPRKALSFSRREFLIDILFNHPDGFKLKPTVFTKDTANLDDEQKIPSTSSKEHLPYFFDTCPFTRQLGEYVKTERVLSTNVRSFRQKYMIGNKIFPTYTLWKTVTGRSASESPNSQNFPKRGKAAKAYRKIFVPPPGYIMLEADLSQAELRISSSMAGEDTMIRIYAEGGDIHRTTACVVLGISEDKFDSLPKEERDLSRFKAKACIAEGQLVLTDHGLVPIEKVKGWHKVWDGVEWVSHDGVVFQGYREVITHDSLTATPDHFVYTEGHADPVPFGDIASKVCTRQIATGAIKDVPVRYSSVNWKSRDEGREEPALCGNDVYKLRQNGVDIGRQHQSETDNDLPLPKKNEVWWRSEGKHAGGKIRRDDAKMLQGHSRILSSLQRSWYTGRVFVKRAFYKMGTEFFSGLGFCRHGFRPGRQLGSLFSGKSTSSIASCKYTKQNAYYKCRVERAYHVLKRLGEKLFPVCGEENVCLGGGWVIPGGYSRECCTDSNHTVWQMEDGMGSYGEEATRSSWQNTTGSITARVPVYDILNAGPRHRFTVSGKVVSNCNFGFIYGMGWKKFLGYAYTQYGVKFTEQEARRIRDAFFTRYSKLPEWHHKVRKFVHRHGYVRSYSGRIRHLPMINSDDEGIRSEAERQGINSPVQEFASTLGVIAFSRLDQEIDPRFLQVVGFVHDAIYAYVPLEFLEWGAKTLKWYMESTPLYKWFGLRLPVPIIADVSFGINGASMNEMKGLNYKDRFDFSGYAEKLGFELPEQKTPPGKGRLDLPAHLNCYA